MSSKKQVKKTVSKKSKSKKTVKVEKKSDKCSCSGGCDSDEQSCDCGEECSGKAVEKTTFVSTMPPYKVLERSRCGDGDKVVGSGDRLVDGDINFLKQKLDEHGTGKDVIRKIVSKVVKFYSEEVRDKEHLIKILNEENILLRRKTAFLEAQVNKKNKFVEDKVMEDFLQGK